MLLTLSRPAEPTRQRNAAERLNDRRQAFEALYMRSYAEMRARRRQPA